MLLDHTQTRTSNIRAEDRHLSAAVLHLSGICTRHCDVWDFKCL